MGCSCFLPFFICQIPGLTSTTSFVIWILLSLLSLQRKLVLYYWSQHVCWLNL
ncbi:hypothetical protein SLEP1_g45270 [Rubroshorea leprosula]|uniref:Uncharacterized protein n=1 Tax=Rubroshorea leprosula TaxID=152421 RepID=A0AAV5LJ90_9ROSI|nr:hypothetical protein SLEP1_g45270 [Rubroshorea leprosula]